MTGVRPRTTPVVRRLGLTDYETVWRDMQRFAELRDNRTRDEVWLLQHPPVYTQGLNCSMTTLAATDIPVVQTDRGGQITYHGPGQVIAYALIDIRRRKLGVKQLVTLLEQSVIDLLDEYGLVGKRRAGAPGVYVDGRKVSALGVRIRHGSSYHGLSLNVDMDLTPFENIDPCGFRGLEVTQLKNLGVEDDADTVAAKISENLSLLLNDDEGRPRNE